MGSKGRAPPPSHLRRPLPGPSMLHPDPFGLGIHPPPASFPFDMLPHPEIMEQKFAAQDVEMQRLLRENQRLAATHLVLRQELAAAQQELQRMHAHMGAMKDEQDQHMSGLLDKIAKMEADLKASEAVNAELQQAHKEAHSLVVARDELIAKVQQLTQDLRRNHADVQQVPALMSELQSLKQEFQHCRATYEYETKLRIDHYESLQVMEKNYISMVREVEKLRAELTNATNLDKSGGSYNNSGGFKENDTTGQRSVGQNAYEDVFGAPPGRGPSGGGAVTYGGGPAGTASTRPGYDAPTRGGAPYDASRNSSYDASRVAAGYDNSRGGSFEPPKGAAAAAVAGYEVPRGGPGYDTANKGAGVAEVPAAAGNVGGPYGSTQTASPYGSAKAPSPYGAAQAPSTYGSAHVPTYGSAQAPTGYGSAQAPNSYGSAQAPNPYGMAQATNPYGSAQPPNPYGSAQAPNPYGSAQATNPYGSAMAPNAYGAQALNPYGSAHATNPYGSAQATNQYGSAQAQPGGGVGYDAPSRGGGGAGAGAGAAGNARR